MLTHVDNRITYSGNGNATEFAYQFKILEKSDIKVMLVKPDGSTQILSKDYYVDAEKGVVIYPGYAPGAEIPESERPPVLPAGWRLVLYREVPITQLVHLPEIWPFNVIEAMADKLTIICQQLKDKLSRALTINESSASNIDTTVPWEAGKTFRVSDDGTHLQATEDPGKVIDEAKRLFDETAANAETAKKSAEEIKKIYDSGGLTPITDLAGSIGTALKRWGYIFANKVFAMNLPIVYKSVAEMKADNLLSAGMTVCTLGYYSPNDGGGATYIIRAKAEGDVDDGGSLHELTSGLVAELVVENGTVNTKQLNLSKDDTDSKNLEKLVAAINKGFAIKFLDVYRVVCTGTQELKKDLVFIGKNASCGLKFSMRNAQYVFTYSDKIKNIVLKNMYFESEIQGQRACLFYAVSTSKTITNMDKFICEGCVFKNNVTLQLSNNGVERIYNDAQELPKISIIIFKNNRVHDCYYSFAHFSDCCFDTCIIENNDIKNIKYLFFAISNENLPDNASELWKDKYNRLFENMKNLIVRNNRIVNEPTIVSSTTNNYCGFIVAETQNVVYTGNHVEGIVSDNGAVYDAYLSCKNVTYTGNVWKNNIAYAHNDNNNFIKCKGNGGIRAYFDNKFIVEKAFVDMLIETYGADRTKCAVGLCSLTSEVDISIENNTFDADVLMFFTSNTPAKTYIFRNNYIKINQYLSSALLSCAKNARAIFENNFLYCTEGSDKELKLFYVSETQNITTKNNTFIFKNVKFVPGETRNTSFFEFQNNNFYTELGIFYFYSGVTSENTNISSKTFRMLWDIDKTKSANFKINSEICDVRIGVGKQGILCCMKQTFFTADGEKEQTFSYKLYEKDGVQRYNINVSNDKTYDDIVPEQTKFINLPFAGSVRISKTKGLDYILNTAISMDEWTIKTFVDDAKNASDEQA